MQAQSPNLAAEGHVETQRPASGTTTGDRASSLMTAGAAIASVVAPVVPYRGRFEAIVNEFHGLGVAGLTIVGTTFLAAAGMVAVAQARGVPGLAAAGAVFLAGAVVLAMLLSRFWQPQEEPADSGSELLRKELLGRGASLAQAGMHDEAISAYNELIDRFATRTEPEVALLAAQAMFAKGMAYGKRKRWDVAVVAFDTLIARFGQTDSRELLVQSGEAMLAKAVALTELDELETAYDVLRDAVSKFSGTNDPQAQRIASQAEAVLSAHAVVAGQAA